MLYNDTMCTWTNVCILNMQWNWIFTGQYLQILSIYALMQKKIWMVQYQAARANCYFLHGNKKVSHNWYHWHILQGSLFSFQIYNHQCQQLSLNGQHIDRPQLSGMYSWWWDNHGVQLLDIKGYPPPLLLMSLEKPQTFLYASHSSGGASQNLRNELF